MGMKGHPQSGAGGGGGGGGEWRTNKKKMAVFAVLLLVGVMGLTVVQKVRDRRMFNLVIKDKDRQILSLHLLLQKERQYVKEHKKKNQDLSAKLFSLRTQKTEFDSKIMEMRSTIGSLRDEQRALELTIDEKQNEIKHKESKINDLKITYRSSPPKIWSVSSDDSSNREVNLTNKISTAITPKVEVQNPSFDHEDDVKSGMKNITVDLKDTRGSEENGGGLSMKGRRYFIGSSGSQMETRKRSVDEERKSDEDEGETEAMSASDADQDYKDETED